MFLLIFYLGVLLHISTSKINIVYITQTSSLSLSIKKSIYIEHLTFSIFHGQIDRNSVHNFTSHWKSLNNFGHPLSSKKKYPILMHSIYISQSKVEGLIDGLIEMLFKVVSLVIQGSLKN